MVLFDYIYFRLAQFFFKKDGAAAYRANTFLTVMQMFLLLEICTLLNRYLLHIDVSKPDIDLRILVAGPVLLLMAYNNYRYKHKYLIFRDKWYDKSTAYIIKGVLVVLALLFPFILLFAMVDNPLFNRLF
ncbi:hypothetical protein [uncultured Pontibacter sp.]|uniref:hypothetical protein n=1 Tax=uncultured Pontibacter sp. TaxID=453356 RepID=UPI00260CBA0D|nr:hypothetical protein [uncultured Pontibacter sp.]